MLCAGLVTIFSSCGQFDPTGYEETATMPAPASITASVGADKVVTVSWTAPSDPTFTGYKLFLDGNYANGVDIPKTETSYKLEGIDWGGVTVVTVKALYPNGKISLGTSTTVTIPVENYPAVTNLTSNVFSRKVTLSWTNPADMQGVTGVRVSVNGTVIDEIQEVVNTCTVKVPNSAGVGEMNFGVELLHYKYYPSAAAYTKNSVTVIPKVAYLLLADSPADLPDDDERAAAEWFSNYPGGEFIKIDQLANLDANEYPVLWIEIDRQNLPLGWNNLPLVSSSEHIAALKAYSAAGGALYLSNMATQLTDPLGFVPQGWNPTVYGNGAGGSGDDVWVINALLGFDFGPDGNRTGEEGFYDRTSHAIYKGLKFEDPNGYGYLALPLIGPGQREDHNCLWDCNMYGKGTEKDVIANFEKNTDSMVLATWGHVRDHCVAAIVDFNAINGQRGQCIANGAAAYEWNQNSGTNPYQGNIEKLTDNILGYLLD